MEDISIKIKKKSLELGYDLCGIIEAKNFEEYIDGLNRRVEKFPDSAHLYESLYSLGTPLEKAPWGKSIIVCVRSYNKYKLHEDLNELFGKVFLFDGRLSYSKEYSNSILFEDYLKEQGMRIFKNEVPARLAAVKAGLGHFGNNNFLHTKFGSWVWIDTWIVDAVMDYNNSPAEKVQACPENCRRCIDACPTKALSDKHAMDRGKCIAHISFDSTELPSEDVRIKMGTWMYGCDVCQDVCPKNNKKWIEDTEFPKLEDMKEFLSLEQIFSMDENTLFEVIQPRFWYIERERMWLWKCNALRAMANSGDKKYHQYIKAACKDSNDKIKSMGLWACEKLGI